MIKIIIDTNIVFSALLNPTNRIAEILLNSEDCMSFYTPSFLRIEIEKHKSKLLKLSKFEEHELEEIKYIIFDRLCFVHEELIPSEVWDESISILKDVDNNDVPFLALSKYMDAGLWTGDLKLINGLKGKGIEKVFELNQILILRDKYRSELL